MVGFLALRGGAPRALACWAYREQRALAGRRGAGRPELDLLGYAPRSQRLAQLLGGVTGSAPARKTCASTALRLGCLVSYSPLAFEDSLQKLLRTGPRLPPEERNTDLENLIWDVVESPVELLFEADLHRRADPTR